MERSIYYGSRSRGRTMWPSLWNSANAPASFRSDAQKRFFWFPRVENSEKVSSKKKHQKALCRYSQTITWQTPTALFVVARIVILKVRSAFKTPAAVFPSLKTRFITSIMALWGFDMVPSCTRSSIGLRSGCSFYKNIWNACDGVLFFTRLLFWVSKEKKKILAVWFICCKLQEHSHIGEKQISTFYYFI